MMFINFQSGKIYRLINLRRTHWSFLSVEKNSRGPPPCNHTPKPRASPSATQYINSLNLADRNDSLLIDDIALYDSPQRSGFET